MHKKHISTVTPKTSWLKPPVSTNIKSGFVLLHKNEEIGEHVTEAREEVLYIIQGEAKVTIEGIEEYAEAGSMLYIPPHKKHNIKNESDEELKYIYVVSHFQ